MEPSRTPRRTSLDRRDFLKLTGLSAAAGALGGPALTPTRVAADNVVKLGIVFPLSGGLAQTGRLNRSGTELAIEIINGKYPDIALPFAATEGIPRLGNAKLQVVWGDTQGNPNVARAEVERLIENERVVLAMEGWTSAEIKTASQAAERLKTPYRA